MFTELESLGFHGVVLMAGFAGGVCYVALQEGMNLRAACSSIVVAVFTANYLSELAAHYLGLGTLLGPAAFIMGLTATWVCKAIMRKAQSWNFSVPADKGDRT